METEHQIQAKIITFLRVHGFYVQRMNSGNYSVGEGRYRRFIMGAEKGTPDILAFKPDPYTGDHALLYFIEVKRPGNKPTPHQAAKMKELEEYGARCFVATSISDVRETMNLKSI